MAEKVKKILHKELPQPVKNAIWEIMQHRKHMRSNIYPFAITHALGAANMALYKRSPKIAIASLAISAGIDATGLYLLKIHQPQYSKEEFNLWTELQKTENPKIKGLLQSFPFVVVDIKGNLVGKKFNPKIGFVPIGRRRIPTKKMPEKIHSKKKKPFHK